MILFICFFGFLGIVLLFNAADDRREAKRATYEHIKHYHTGRGNTQLWIAIICMVTAFCFLLEML